MRGCYDSLLSAAAATANSAYGTSLMRFFFSLIKFSHILSHECSIIIIISTL